ncbi:hypothetical protein TTHERM_000245819 (macronuclear) [Tetrahymena thermophila SB210]|uniref:Uncharacterized protein n=1 Tax=Tetrahymena thermophila (strain SB210) TaxID=312017 RepID=W7WYU8_TETTS|nr:hypothetical protein TTHERM_000245819 [Tetrahymena thermophila SB210]EWS72080.1 hypothetical protein TTHERM_000245819 [Tetrahymena thermophila SB210]|eukprot:XP_012655391.1 hypothetical protein TTHERM_000245819 [Tetrahymena thermophila SB210]
MITANNQINQDGKKQNYEDNKIFNDKTVYNNQEKQVPEKEEEEKFENNNLKENAQKNNEREQRLDSQNSISQCIKEAHM